MPPLPGSHFGNACPWTSVSADATIAAATAALRQRLEVLALDPHPAHLENEAGCTQAVDVRAEPDPHGDEEHHRVEDQFRYGDSRIVQSLIPAEQVAHRQRFVNPRQHVAVHAPAGMFLVADSREPPRPPGAQARCNAPQLLAKSSC